MDIFPQITDLFSRLALRLQITAPNSQFIDQLKDDDSYSIDLAISNLNQSLNLAEDSGVRVLDAALSIMCFKAPEVFDSTIECMVKTIVSVLCSSVDCNVMQIGEEEVLLVGCSIPKRSCLEFVEVVNDIVSKLDELGRPSDLLSGAVARAAVSTSSCSLAVPPMYILDDQSTHVRSSGIQKLCSNLPRESSFDSHEIPPRLLSWYLDPLNLKQDILIILEGTAQRPFLPFSKEFRERKEWHNILMCLIISPMMFIHSLGLLYNWFLLTGQGFVLELLSRLVGVILDVNSRPTFWGISIGLGSKLPLYTAYFPYQNDLLRTLAGPLSSSSFLHLYQKIFEPVTAGEQFGQISKTSAVNISSIDSKSLWALAICFPDWFCFASVLLFSGNSFGEGSQLKCMPGEHNSGKISSEEPPSSAAAARYISWILIPHRKSHQDMVFDSLMKISESWARKQIGSGSSGGVLPGSRKKLRKLKFQESEDNYSTNKYQIEVIVLWLKEFQTVLKNGLDSVNNSSSCEAKTCSFNSESSMFFRRIPLGILISFPDHVKEDGFELLLQYAAAGKMVSKADYRKQNSGDEFGLNFEFTKKEAIAGACLIFWLTDTVERMSPLFKSERSETDIVCIIKLRVSGYLIKCIKRIIWFNTDEDGGVMLTDLHEKLEHWRHQGNEMCQLDKDLDNEIKGLSYTLLSL